NLPSLHHFSIYSPLLPPTSTLFPYTTLFRSDAGVDVNPNQDDDHDDPRDEEVPNEPLPKALGLLVFLVVAHLAGHRSWAKGGMPYKVHAERCYKSNVAIDRRTGYATL